MRCCIVAFGSAHVNDGRQLAQLNATMASWRAQTTPVCLLLAVSAVPRMVKSVRDAARRWSEAGRTDLLYTLLVDPGLSVFRRYAVLLSRMPDAPRDWTTWVLFAPDTAGVWHVQRTAVYTAVLREDAERGGDLLRDASAIDVPARLDLPANHLPGVPLGVTVHGDPACHWTLACRLRSLRAFCEAVPRRVLEDAHCGHYFSRWLRSAQVLSVHLAWGQWAAAAMPAALPGTLVAQLVRAVAAGCWTADALTDAVRDACTDRGLLHRLVLSIVQTKTLEPFLRAARALPDPVPSPRAHL